MTAKQSHVSRLQSTHVSLHCGRIGNVNVTFSEAQAKQACTITGLENGAQALAKLINDSTLRFDAMDSEFERGAGRRKGSLYVHVSQLGPVPLSLKFDETNIRNMEELGVTNRLGSLTQAHLLADTLNQSQEPKRAAATANRGAFIS